MYAIFIPFSKLCCPLGLFVCWLGDLCLALRLSISWWWTYVEHWVCLFLGWGLMLGIGFVCFLVTYVWHCICLFWGVVLCWALGLSVSLLGTYVWHWVHLFLGCVTYVWKWLGYLEQAELINCFSNIW